MQTVRVATLNIWNTQGPWERRRELIRCGIAALAPDAMGLEEVLLLGPGDGDVPENQATALTRGLGYNVAYGPAQTLGPGLYFGNAVITPHKILSHGHVRLPGEESGETRCLLYAIIETPRGRLPFFVTHLNWKLGEGSIRMRQVLFIVDQIEALAPPGSAELPPVLVGDLNAEPESDEIRFLEGLATVDGRSVFFADAWRWAGDGSPGYTFNRRNPFAALAHEPPRRIDYILVGGPDPRHHGEPQRTSIVFDAPEEGIWPSDHFGLVSDISTVRTK